MHGLLPFALARADLEDAQNSIDFEADGLFLMFDDDDARVLSLAVVTMSQSRADIEQRDDRAAQRDDADDRGVGVRYTRDRTRLHDLDHPVAVERVMLAGDDEGDDFELAGRRGDLCCRRDL